MGGISEEKKIVCIVNIRIYILVPPLESLKKLASEGPQANLRPDLIEEGSDH